jgi:4-hydroxy-3-methylbut-2-enyl diphosphate reductase
MPRKFHIPDKYRSQLISYLKKARAEMDLKKRDKSPTIIDLGCVRLKFARHFGFCYGVENAIEIAYRAVDENPGKRVFLLSEMIHNPHVNADLRARGVEFLFSTYGKELISLSQVEKDDIVIIPAFGTTLEMCALLEEKGVDIQSYNTTCPFVERVWKRGTQIGERGFSIVIHGKARHEETQATFSHASRVAPSIIVADISEAQWLKSFILGKETKDDFEKRFSGRLSATFCPDTDLEKIGVINQTTMLATETSEISAILRSGMEEKYGKAAIVDHFADTRDTLCYATAENQESTKRLIESGGDIAIIVGGYNSSNTSHLVELCVDHFPTYFIDGPKSLHSLDAVMHLDIGSGLETVTEGWYPRKQAPVEVLITSGASCPDALVQGVVERLLQLLGLSQSELTEAIEQYVGSLSLDEPPFRVLNER